MNRISTGPTLAAELDWTEAWLSRIIERAQRDRHVEYRDGHIALTSHGDEAAHSIARSIGVPVD